MLMKYHPFDQLKIFKHPRCDWRITFPDEEGANTKKKDRKASPQIAKMKENIAGDKQTTFLNKTWLTPLWWSVCICVDITNINLRLAFPPHSPSFSNMLEDAEKSTTTHTNQTSLQERSLTSVCQQENMLVFECLNEAWTCLGCFNPYLQPCKTKMTLENPPYSIGNTSSNGGFPLSC